MKNDGLISVIVPVYNVEPWLETCLTSIIHQTYKNIEIICIDDGSTDGCNDILQKYKEIDSRITIIKNPKNLGLGFSRNKGFSLAKGKWIHFVDSDDWLELDAYERLLEKLNSLDFEPDLLFFTYKKFYEKSGKYVKIDFKNKLILDKNLNPTEDVVTFDNWDRYVWMKLHRREFLKKNNISFNNYECMEDMEYAALLYVKAKSVVYTDICCINYRQRANSLVTKTNQFVDTKVKSFFYDKKLYKDLKDEIRYKLLGFDYFQICYDMEKAWLKGYISIFYVIYNLWKLNKKDVNNYIYENKTLKESGKIMKFYPMFVNKYFNGDKYWYKKIFSIQNVYNKNKKHKCICILGIKLKIKIAV